MNRNKVELSEAAGRTKILFLLLAIALFIGACGSNDTKKEEQAADETTVVAAENLVEVCIGVEGMTCEGCENAVKKSIETLEGIAEVSASHVDSVAVVKYDATKTSPEDIQGKIADAGYVVRDEG